MATAGSEGYIAYAVVLALDGRCVFQLASGGAASSGTGGQFPIPPRGQRVHQCRPPSSLPPPSCPKCSGSMWTTAAHHYETIWRVIEACHALHPLAHFVDGGILAFGVMYGLKAVCSANPQCAGGCGADHPDFLGYSGFRARSDRQSGPRWCRPEGPDNWSSQFNSCRQGNRMPLVNNRGPKSAIRLTEAEERT